MKHRFNIKKSREKLTEQDIHQNMNFDKFISTYTPPVKGWFSGGTKLFTLLSSSAAVLVFAGYLIYKSGKGAETPAISFINPPLPALNIPADTYVLNSSTDTTFVHSTGTMITIPAGSFVDENGSPVNGKIDIHYREFHDPVDIMLSGVPMNYDSAGIHYQLESGGMFEILATRDGKPVFLKPGKELSVNMISRTNNPTDFNIYNLDTVKKQWQYISENTEKNNTCFPVYEPEPELLRKMKSENAAIALQKPLRPKKADQHANNFSIDFQKDDFPELAVYKGLKFEPVPGEKNYRPSLAKKTWEDVLIEKHPDNEHYIITFSTGKESHSFTVSPVVDEKEYDLTMKEYAMRQKRYERLLAEKKRNDLLRNDSLYTINARYARTAARSNLNDRFNSFIKNSYSETTQDMLAYRTFAVSKLGVWNCDQPAPFFVDDKFIKKSTGEYNAQFISADGQPLVLKSVYLLKRAKNSLYVVSESGFKHFPVSTGVVDVMIGITYENKLLYLKDQELEKAEITGKNVVYKMNSVGAGIENPQQLKQLLKI